jgi:hypothetical protein
MINELRKKLINENITDELIKDFEKENLQMDNLSIFNSKSN